MCAWTLKPPADCPTIAAELRDVVVDPAQRRLLILEAVVTRRASAFGSERGVW
jgi:hypothetical protein